MPPGVSDSWLGEYHAMTAWKMRGGGSDQYTHAIPKPLLNTESCGTHFGTRLPKRRQASSAPGIAKVKAMLSLER